MPIFSGNNKMGLIFFGSNSIDRVYYGSTLVYSSWKDVLITTSTSKTYKLPKGKYRITIRASGGGGGQGGYTRGNWRYVDGGAGGQGGILCEEYTISRTQTVQVYLGPAGDGGIEPGRRGAGYTGNGGAPGDGFITKDASMNAGYGGGGARPAYVFFEDGRKFIAQGGGGGGGGGAGGTKGRRSRGGPGGGGGGGYYMQPDGTLIEIRGQKGANTTSYYHYGDAGVGGETRFGGSDYKAGSGGGGSHYQKGQGGAGGVGFGASGGAGNAGDKNNHTHSSSQGGSGGGGAPGGSTAKGGGCAPYVGSGAAPISASNATCQPDDVSSWNTAHGLPTYAGRGGYGYVSSSTASSGDYAGEGYPGAVGAIKIEKIG